MPYRILVFYGSYRSDRMGIRLANYIVSKLETRGADVELVDAKAVGLPMLDRMYKEHKPGSAPAAMEEREARVPRRRHAPLSRGVVLATRRHCELFRRPPFGCKVKLHMAWHAFRNGDDRHLEHPCGRANSDNP